MKSRLWEKLARDFSWTTPYHRLYDPSVSPVRSWFTAGTLSYSASILDLKIGSGAAQKEIFVVYKKDGSVLRYTYAQLLHEVNTLCFFLRGRGVTRNKRVLILLAHDDVEFSILLALSLQRIGALFGFLFPRFPRESVTFFLEKSRAHFLISDRALYKPSGRPAGYTLIERSSIRPGACAPSVLPPASVAADRPSFFVFTSGTTSSPRIIRAGHLGFLLSLISFMQGQMHADDKTRSIIALHPSFGPALGLYYAAFFLGSTVIVSERRDYLSSGEFREIIRKEKVGGLYMTPSLAQMVKVRVDAPLRLAFTGDRISRSLWQHCAAAFPLAQCVNCYGLAETMALLSSGPVALKPSYFKKINLLRPINSVEYSVADAAENGVGRLLIRNTLPSLSKGYYGDDAIYRRRFVRQARYFDTADLVREKGGTLEVIGRADTLTKIKCRYLEPALIEEGLKKAGYAGELKVICRQAQVYLFVAGRALSEDKIRSFIRRRIGSYALPRKIIVLDALPRTFTGKVDERELCRRLNVS